MKKEKNIIQKTIIFITVILLVLLTNYLINLYNEKTLITVKDNDIESIYQKYQVNIKKIYNTLEKISLKTNNIYTLKDEYKDNSKYKNYNGLLLKISNILNSKESIFLLEKPTNNINYKTINYDSKLLTYKQVLNSINNNQNDEIINSYINTVINLININSESNYQNSKKTNLFNILGKSLIYTDYKKLLENELELTAIINNLVEYIEKNI